MTMSLEESIQQFFTSPAYAVVGASTRRTKFGSKVLRCYMQHQKRVFPVNPGDNMIEGLPCAHRVKDLPAMVQSISIVTPPSISEQVVVEAVRKGIKNIWLQPGAETAVAVDYAKRHGVNIIAGGPCILATLGFKDYERVTL